MYADHDFIIAMRLRRIKTNVRKRNNQLSREAAYTRAYITHILLLHHAIP